MPDAKSVKNPNPGAAQKSSEVVSAWVSSDVKQCIREDVASMERGSESYVISKILGRHYAKRIGSKRASSPMIQLKRAA